MPKHQLIRHKTRPRSSLTSRVRSDQVVPQRRYGPTPNSRGNRNRTRPHNLTMPTAKSHPPSRSDRIEGMSNGPHTGSFGRTPGRALKSQPVRLRTRSCYNMSMAPNRILIHISRTEHRVLDPDDVYLLNALGGETEVRLRSRKPLVDVRPIGEVMASLEKHGIIRIHREHAVNIAHIRLLRLQSDGRDWEVKMESPVHRVLPVAADADGKRTVFRSYADSVPRKSGQQFEVMRTL